MSHPTDPNCTFCKIVAGQIPCFKLLEDQETIAFMDIAPAALAKVRTPEANAVMPNTTCSKSGNRKTKLPAPARNSEPPPMLARKVAMRKIDRLSSGCT